MHFDGALSVVKSPVRAFLATGCSVGSFFVFTELRVLLCLSFALQVSGDEVVKHQKI
jgi:hypothetical protein